MRIAYHPDTDSLYIDLAPRPRVESREVAPGVVIDFDAQGDVVGIDIDHASEKLDLAELTLSRLPAEVRRRTA